jgi:hypothetical protein
MIYEKLNLQFDIQQLNQFLEKEVLFLPPAQGPALIGWSILSSNGSYLDGWHDATALIKNSMSQNDVEQALAQKGAQSMQKYNVPTEICKGYLAEVLKVIEETGIEIYRARISCLMPGEGADWHRDAPDNHYRVRLHIPLVTNPDCFFETREEKAHLAADGSVYLLNVNCEHRVFNLGSAPRYHIIMDAIDRSGFSQHHRYSDWLAKEALLSTRKTEYSKSNHMKMGYDGQWFNLRTSPLSRWQIGYGMVRRPVGNFREECIKAASEIADHFQLPISIGFSGGVDSEIVAESFRLAQIPYKAIIMRFPEGQNSHDINYAENYCRRWNIPIQYFNIDPLAYYKTKEFSQRVQKTHCLYPMLALQAKVLEHVHHQGGICVMGAGDFLFGGEANQQVIVTHKEVSGSVFRIQASENFGGVYRFFRWSPELIASFFMDPSIQELIHNKSVKRDFGAPEKLKFYQSHFEVAERKKYYGWEQFAAQEAQIRSSLLVHFPYANTEIKITYDQFADLLGLKQYEASA